MEVILLGLGLFLVFFGLHCLIWRIHVPRRQAWRLLELFLVVMVLGCLFFWVARESALLLLSLADFLHSFFLSALLFAGYLVSYPAIERDIPSFIVINSIADRGAKGLTKELLEQELTDELLVKPRFEDLITEKLIFAGTDGKFRLTPKGRLFIQPFFFYRNLVDAGKGG